jgi:hypothetical protein
MAAVVGPDIDAAVTRLRAAGASLVAVSGHHSTPNTMRRFAAAFDTGFREVQVGDEIHVTVAHRNTAGSSNGRCRGRSRATDAALNCTASRCRRQDTDRADH